MKINKRRREEAAVKETPRKGEGYDMQKIVKFASICKSINNNLYK